MFYLATHANPRLRGVSGATNPSHTLPLLPTLHCAGYGGSVTSDIAPPAPPSHAPLRFAIIGQGAIAQELQRLIPTLGTLRTELHPVGTVTRSPESLERALAVADVIVEAAGVSAVTTYGPRVIAAGLDFLVTSVGAFAEPAALTQLRAAGPGRVHLTSGAIGGLDLLTAAGRTGGLDHVSVRSSKLPGALRQPWMSAEEAAHLAELSTSEVIFSGSAQEAIAKFPSSLNVATAVQLAVGDAVPVRVELCADPAATLTEHAIHATGPAGSYDFVIRNEPLAARPASSGLTARALVADLAELAAARRVRP